MDDVTVVKLGTVFAVNVNFCDHLLVGNDFQSSRLKLFFEEGINQNRILHAETAQGGRIRQHEIHHTGIEVNFQIVIERLERGLEQINHLFSDFLDLGNDYGFSAPSLSRFYHQFC